MSKDYFSKNTRSHPQRKKKKMLSKYFRHQKTRDFPIDFTLKYILLFKFKVTEKTLALLQHC